MSSVAEKPPAADVLDVPITDSPAIRRLIEEVRQDEAAGVPRSYNRVYNRHNRS
jgi:hypothetical protein